MNWAREWKWLLLIAAGFAAAFWLPVERLGFDVGQPRLQGAVAEALHLTRWYAREHVILCLIPAFFIAGAIGVFISQASVMKYLGANAPKLVAYGVASISGTVLAVCSCTVLPLFAGIWRMGAGLGPATAFLYSGPAINVLAIILTARVLGLEMGIARAVGAVVFSVVIGLAMHLIFRREELARAKAQALLPEAEVKRPLWQTTLYFAAMIGVLIFTNWGQADASEGFWYTVYALKWPITAAFALGLALTLVAWIGLSWRHVGLVVLVTAAVALLWPSQPMLGFLVGALGLSLITAIHEGEAGEWFSASWTFAKQILPLLLAGVLVAGFLLGRPGYEGLIPTEWVRRAVGGNSLASNLFASVAGAFMYFATLTEVPVLQGLMGDPANPSMGKGPALALLLAGPALSLPSMLVLRSVMGLKKTVVYCTLVVVMATISGLIFGTM